MAQVLKLKRTAVQGKIPTTDTLELGELAINTYDGKLYFEKDNGIPSIQTIVVTDALITGSLNINGAITASYFKGDGSQITFGGTGMVSGSSQLTSSLDSRYLNTLGEGTISGSFSGEFAGDGSGLTNLPASDVSQVATVTASFDATSSIAVTHNFNSKNILVSVYGTNDAQIIPSSVVLTNNNTTTIGLSSPQSGYVVVAKGGHIVSGTLVQEVTTVATVTASFDTQSTISVTHNFNSKNLVISVYNSNDSQIIPASVTLTNLNTATIGLSSPQSGYVVVAKGGHLVTAVGTVSYNTLTDIPTGILSSSAVPAGTISGSSQLTSSYDSRYTLSGSISAVPIGTISGSSQLTASVLATTGSNTFVGTQTLSGSLIPATDNTYDLGSVTYQWRDIYVSSGSLYIDGTKVLGSTNQELQITTDVGQSIKILEAGSDSIILQSADGDIQLKTSGGGNLLFDPTTGLIDVRGTLQIQDGNKITSSGGNGIVFGNNIVVSGSIESTSTINGINLTTFSSSVASTLLNQNTATSSYETKGSGIISGSSQLTSSYDTRYVLSGSITQTTWDNIASKPGGIISGSSQLNNASIENLTVINLTTVNETASVIFSSGSNRFGDFGNDTHSFTGSVQVSGSITTLGSSTATSYNGTINATNGIVSGSSQITYASISSIPAGIVSGSAQTILNLPTGVVSGSAQTILNLPTGVVSGSSQINVMSTTNIARLATTGSNTFVGNQTVTGNILPEANGTRDLGSAALRWSTVYTSDLSLNNGIGDWTIVEGEDDLFLYNNKKGKVYKFALTEVDPNIATPKKS